MGCRGTELDADTDGDGDDDGVVGSLWKEMGLKKERLLGLEGIKVLGQRGGFGSLVVNNRREDEIDEDIAVFGGQRIPERKREGWWLLLYLI